MKIARIIKMAISSLRVNKMRTFLSTSYYFSWIWRSTFYSFKY